MRDWRKVHKVIASSEKLTQADYETRWLYVLLLVYQDDDGKFPWTPAMVRTLTATTDWTFDKATEHRKSLESLGLGDMDGTMFTIRRGAELNGAPTSGRMAGVRRTYPTAAMEAERTSHGSTPHVPGTSRSEEIRGEERREEKSTTTAPQDELVEASVETKSPTTSPQPVWTVPDWFAPIVQLSGYKNRNHSQAIRGIEAACRECNVDPGLVIDSFAATWPTLKVKYRWSDPVATLKGKPLEIAINNVRNGGSNGERGTSRVRPTRPEPRTEGTDFKGTGW